MNRTEKRTEEKVALGGLFPGHFPVLGLESFQFFVHLFSFPGSGFKFTQQRMGGQVGLFPVH